MIVRRVKSIVYLLLVVVGLISPMSALEAAGDPLKLSAHFTSTPLARVLQVLHKRYGLDFSYEPQVIEETYITCKFEDLPLGQALTRIFADSDLEYRLIGKNQVLIRPRRQAESPFPVAEASFLLQGEVRAEESGDPLPYASVWMKERGKGVLADVNGQFSLEIPHQQDSIALRIAYVGCFAKNIRIAIKDGVYETVFLRSKEKVLEAITIEDKPSVFNASTGISRLTLRPTQLASLPSLGEQDLMRSLQYLPGINGTQDNSIGLSVRGGSVDQNLVILDDIPLYKVEHFWGVISTFNADAIDKLTLYKSDFPLRYGGRTSSVVELQGREADEALHARIGLNLLSAQARLELPIGKKLSLMLAGRRSYTDVIQSKVYQDLFSMVDESEELSRRVGAPRKSFAAADTSKRRINTLGQLVPDYFFYDINGRLSYRVSQKHSLHLNYFESGDELNFTRDRRYRYIRRGRRVPVEENSRYFNHWGNQGLSLQWESQLSGKVDLYLSASTAKFNEQERNRSTVDLLRPDTTRLLSEFKSETENQIRDRNVRAELSWRPDARRHFQGGVHWTDTRLEYDLALEQESSIDQNGTASLLGLWASYNWQWTEDWTLKLGLRDNFYQQTGKHYLSPRIALQFHANPSLSVKGAWGKYYQFTKEVNLFNRIGDLQSFWGAADGREIAVSSSEHVVAGLQWRSNSFLVDIEGYHRSLRGLNTFATGRIDVQELIEQEGTNTDFRVFQGTGKAWGWDVLLQKTQGNYTGWLAYSFGRMRVKYPKLNRGEAFAAEEELGHQLKWIHMLKLGKWDFAFTWIFGSSQPFTDLDRLLEGEDLAIESARLQEDKLPDYHRMDISATYNFSTKHVKGKVGAAIFNLWDRQNVKYRQYLYAIRESLDTPDPGTPRLVAEDVRMLGFTPNLFLSLDF